VTGNRHRVIAGNWKMFKTPVETSRFFQDFLARHLGAPDRDVLFFPPAISLTAAVDALRERPEIGLGVQNIHWEREGAFTGETSAAMAAAARAFALISLGRQHVFGRPDAQVARKVVAALAAGAPSDLCWG
jgi:triosephosphate isomerase